MVENKGDVPEMVERVARAMATRVRYKIDEGNPAIGRPPAYLVYTEDAWQQFVEGARAAIEAMREPTTGMVQVLVDYDHPEVTPIEKSLGQIWRAMIDTALREP